MIAFALTLIGTLLLCASMRKHWKQLVPQRKFSHRTANVLRAAGYLVLLAGATVASSRHGIGPGLVIFFGFLTFATLAIAVALPYWTERASRRT
ncbi:MAG: DUF3325 domain-containing protein [Acidobacteriota bacterium]